jgi:hypothetical protein
MLFQNSGQPGLVAFASAFAFASRLLAEVGGTAPLFLRPDGWCEAQR